MTPGQMSSLILMDELLHHPRMKTTLGIYRRIRIQGFSGGAKWIWSTDQLPPRAARASSIPLKAVAMGLLGWPSFGFLKTKRLNERVPSKKTHSNGGPIAKLASFPLPCLCGGFLDLDMLNLKEGFRFLL